MSQTWTRTSGSHARDPVAGTGTGHVDGYTGAHAEEPAVGALVHRLTEQIPQLVRSEVRLAQAELAAKGKQAGMGVGMFSVAGLLAFFGLACLIATAIIALALALPWWASALIVAVVLLVVAGISAMLGRKRLQHAGPPKPEVTIESVRADVAAVKGGRSWDSTTAPS